MIPTLLMVCVSQVLPYSLTLGDATEHGTIAYRTPSHCAADLVPALPRYEYGPARPAAAAPAAKPAVAATTPAPRVKKAATKRAKCKPGRVRDLRGICRRKR